MSHKPWDKQPAPPPNTVSLPTRQTRLFGFSARHFSSCSQLMFWMEGNAFLIPYVTIRMEKVGAVAFGFDPLLASAMTGGILNVAHA